MRPAGPTKGCPARSSASPGCSPTSMIRALGLPSPNTVWVAFFHSGQPRQPAASLRSASSVNAVGRRGVFIGKGEQNHSFHVGKRRRPPIVGHPRPTLAGTGGGGDCSRKRRYRAGGVFKARALEPKKDL